MVPSDLHIHAMASVCPSHTFFFNDKKCVAFSGTKAQQPEKRRLISVIQAAGGERASAPYAVILLLGLRTDKLRHHWPC